MLPDCFHSATVVFAPRVFFLCFSDLFSPCGCFFYLQQRPPHSPPTCRPQAMTCSTTRPRHRIHRRRLRSLPWCRHTAPATTAMVGTSATIRRSHRQRSHPRCSLQRHQRPLSRTNRRQLMRHSLRRHYRRRHRRRRPRQSVSLRFRLLLCLLLLLLQQALAAVWRRAVAAATLTATVAAVIRLLLLPAAAPLPTCG